jgi:hypothetical protein
MNKAHISFISVDFTAQAVSFVAPMDFAMPQAQAEISEKGSG